MPGNELLWGLWAGQMARCVRGEITVELLFDELNRLRELAGSAALTKTAAGIEALRFVVLAHKDDCVQCGECGACVTEAERRHNCRRMEA